MGVSKSQSISGVKSKVTVRVSGENLTGGLSMRLQAQGRFQLGDLGRAAGVVARRIEKPSEGGGVAEGGAEGAVARVLKVKSRRDRGRHVSGKGREGPLRSRERL